MKLADVSIKRPVFASMIMAALVVFGGFLYTKLNVDLYPEVDFPIVTVTAVYPGAGPETMESQVADPMEEAFNSLGGIKSLRSVSVEGVAQVYIEFNLGVDLATATQDVRDRLDGVDLPEGMENPSVQKVDLGAAPVLQMAVGGSQDLASLSTYVEDQLKPSLERIDGVGEVEIIGGTEREVHVWVKPEALRAAGVTLTEVVGALGAQNIEVPGGRVDDGEKELIVRTNAQAQAPEDLGRMVLTTIDQVPVYLSDVARIEDGFEERRSSANLDGKTAVAVVLRKQSDANTVKVADAVFAQLDALRAGAPTGTSISVVVDSSRQIRASIDTVELDLILGAILAIVIIFVFLRDWRATLISALALPTSVIGTFAFVNVMGFTLNMMTTLALSLSIGILIDDAIVVIENIVRRRTVFGEAPMEAAQRGTAEIGLAVMATTLCIVAVFVPVAFMDGMVGQFFYEFGLTVAVAVLLSLFVSFTMTPMLSSRFLKAHDAHPTGLSGAIEAVLQGMERIYRRIVGWALRHRLVTVVLAVGTLIGTFALVPRIGFEFVPATDTGQFDVSLEMPPSTSLKTAERRVADVAARIREIPGVTSTFATLGGGAQEKVNSGKIVVTLVPKDARAFSQADALVYVRQVLAGEPNMIVSVSNPQNAGAAAGGRNAPIMLNLRGPDLAALQTAADAIKAELSQTAGFADVDTSTRGGKQELTLQVDRARAADLGVMSADAATTVRALISGAVATQFERDGERYDVRVQLEEADRRSMAAVERAQVRSRNGTLVDLQDIGAVVSGSGPSQIDRQARQRQVTLYANLDGLPLGAAMTQVESITRKHLPANAIMEFGGDSQRMQESAVSMLISLILAILCVYMILASQFESFAQPFTIMASLPFSLIGAFGGLLVTGMNMSIFGMIGIIMLMGLVTKNAILLIDAAIDRRRQGSALNDALEHAGATRLRPILMTTAAMIFGMLPVAIGHGDGGEMRAPMGVIIIGGLISSTILTLVVVPVIYNLVDGMTVRVGRLFGRKERPVHSEVPAA